jgi:hypothetical protein
MAASSSVNGELTIALNGAALALDALPVGEGESRENLGEAIAAILRASLAIKALQELEKPVQH